MNAEEALQLRWLAEASKRLVEASKRLATEMESDSELLKHRVEGKRRVIPEADGGLPSEELSRAKGESRR